MVHILWFPFFTQWYIFEIDPCWYMWTLSIHSNLEYSIMHINQLTYPWHSKMKNGSFPLFQNQKLGSTTILSHAAWRPCAHTPTRNTDKLLFPHVLTLDVTTLFFFFFDVMWCLNIWFCVYLIDSGVDPGVESLLKWPPTPGVHALYDSLLSMGWTQWLTCL